MKKTYENVYAVIVRSLIPRVKYGDYDVSLYPKINLEEKYMNSGIPYYGLYFFDSEEKATKFSDKLKERNR